MGKLAQKLAGQSQSQVQTKKNGGKVESKSSCAKACGGMVKGKK